MKKTTVKAALLASLTLSSPFAGPASAQASGNQPDFDFYILSLSVAPSFCDLTGFKKHKAECFHGSDAAYQATPLTVHGLWPNKDNTPTRNQPEDCATTQSPDELPGTVQAGLARSMPGVEDGLADHEWATHGSCSGLGYSEYFGDIVTLAALMDAKISSVVRDNNFLGTNTQISSLVSKIAEKDPDLASAIIVNCQFAHPRDGGPARAYISELRVLIGKDLSSLKAGGNPTFIALADKPPFHQNSGCPQGGGFWPGGFED